MIKYIVKRDGRKVEFTTDKIAHAIFKAAKKVGGADFNKSMDLAQLVAKAYRSKHKNDDIPTVEEIQDLVEKILIENGHAKTAKEYILYRNNRSKSRELKTNLMETMKELTFASSKDSDIKRENANINTDTAMGTMLKYGSTTSREFYRLMILDDDVSEAHKNGDIHIHDLDFYTLTTTCTQISLKKLFKDGFSTGHGILREPNDIMSYSALACIAIQSNQNDQHGGQSIPCFDYDLADGVKKTYIKRYKQNLKRAIELICGTTSDEANIIVDMILKRDEYSYDIIPSLDTSNNSMDAYTQKETIKSFLKCEDNVAERIYKFVISNSLAETDRATYQAMEGLIHNLNTMNSRAGAQVPFSSINYGTDTSSEGRMIIKNILLAEEAGLGNGETPIFPIHIFKVKEGINFNEDDPNYDMFKLACRVSAKRLFPNFSFIDAPFNLQYYKPNEPDTEIAYMGCRTRVIGNVYDKDNEIVTGRGNLSFTSINLPRLAIKANRDVSKFFELLNEMMDLTVKQLLHRFEIQCQKTVRNYPFLMGQGVWLGSEKLSIDDNVREVLKHGTLSVGFIGLAETLKCLIGEHHGESDIARALGLQIVKYMRDRMDAECEKTGLNFSLLATPAEGLSGRFVKIDKEKYGKIEGVTDRDYYTNSFHVPVYYPISAFKKIEIEAEYHELTNAGHITYVEIDGDPLENLSAFEKIIRYMKKCGIGYGSINHPVDRDPKCGFSGIIGETCPKCGRKENSDNIGFERIRRITGYLVGSLDRWNNAKTAEEHDRVKHDIM